MKGVGGPLLSIGDLLSDLAEREEEIVAASVAAPDHAPSSSISDSNVIQSLDLKKLFQVLFSLRFEAGVRVLDCPIHDDKILFALIAVTLLIDDQEEYERLNEALAGTDHSWTALTLKLCSSLETANKLVQSTNSNVTLLSEKVKELDKIVKRGDSAVAAAKAIHVSLNQMGGHKNI